MRPLAPSIRSFLVLALFLALIPCRAAAQTSQILEIASDSLTSYRYTGNTLVQGVRPQYNQRGVTIDGAMRSAPAYPMVLAGNPFENAWTGRESYGGIRADLGAFARQDIDIALPTDGIPWVIGRTYNARQLDSGGSAMNSNGYQGKNWFQTSQPEIRFYDDATNTKDLIYIVYGADRYVEFARAGTSSNQFKGKNGAAGCVNYVSGSPDTYVYTDQHGNEWTFFGFNTSSNTTDGQFWKVTTPNSKTSFVGDASTASTAITNGYSGGKITTAYDASDRRFTYTYSTLNGTSRLTQVKAETKTGGTWSGSPTGVATAVQVDYTYYADESHGDIGDLKQVKITTRLNDSGGETDEQVKRKHYRYWEGSADDTANYNASTNPGYPHELKYVYDFEGVRVYDWQDSNFDEDHLTETDANLEPYASAYFEYESGRKIREAWFDGQCGCGGGSDGTFAFTYGTNGSYTNNSGYDTAWCARTVVERPDGSFLTQYFDEVGQGISQVVSDADPSGAASKWVTYVVRDTDGRVSAIHTPENLDSYTHSTGSITPKTSDAGLVRVCVRAASGNMTGFVTDWKHQLGWDPSPPTTVKTKYFDASQTFTSLTKNITDVTVVRPLIATKVVYSQEITSGSSGAYTTSYSYTDYSGSSQPLTYEKITQTNPTVTTGNNGSNVATSIERHYRKDTLIDFQKNEDLTIDYWGYTNSQVSRAIRDVDVTKTGAGEDLDGVSVPSGFNKTGTPLIKRTDTTYTSQGFMLQQSPPEGNRQVYQSRLADHRLIRIEYNDYQAGPNYYGPAWFSVTNQAGKVEAEGVIAYTSNVTSSGQDNHVDETDADPLLAINVGSVAQLRTNVYNETGHDLEESRVYFSVPGSGAGSEGTNYDATRYAYDDAGRRIRTKEPTGTIRRSTFDLFGRVTASSIGTNDNGLPAGESSGSSNMVTTETREFDTGSSGLNGNLTTVARYYDSSNHNDTTFKYDYRGRRIVELSPLAPFTLNKLDNMGRSIAVGQYSSSSGLDETDDPTSLTTNRMALNQTFFDERGQVWKSQRHKIDDADGSDDDNLQTLNWYDDRGRLIKTDGPQLSKTVYDRLSRVTDVYVLAVDDDAAYSDADDVTGDIVLEERQMRYDATTGTVILEARIDRFHDDYDTGETTGKLDTNADASSLKLTFSNLEGRAQITAKWYDDLERLSDQVEYGTNGGSDFDRNGLSVPARSDTALRTSWAYNTDGTVDTITDPKALVTKRTYDAEGRVTKEIKNYVDGTPGSGTDEDVTVVYEYTNGLRTKLKADLPAGQTDQETVYIYGSTSGTPSQMKIATGHLLRATKYPDTTNNGTTVANIDSDSSDVVSFAYDAQGQRGLQEGSGRQCPRVGLRREW
jgi:YD repeat-containing protein